MNNQLILRCRLVVRNNFFSNSNLASKVYAAQRTFVIGSKMSNNGNKTGASGLDKCKVKLSEDEWKKKLTSEQYYVCRQKGTEPPFSGEYNHHDKKGTYICVGCGATLFSSDTKFDSGCGWPAFHTALGAKEGDETDANVARQSDNSLGRQRTEVLCKQCHSHLGHVFEDGPQPTGERFCINSVALNFKPSKN